MKAWILFFFVALSAMLTVSCAESPAEMAVEVEVVWVGEVPEEPTHEAWETAPAFSAELIPQDLVEPRLLTPTTPRVSVRAVTDGERIAFRLSWADPTKDDLPKASRFSDACAVQLPLESGPDLPAPQMGEPGRSVEITYWRASWQAVVDGRPHELRTLYPGASIDHYPFEASSLEPGSEAQEKMALRYAPAHGLGNVMEGPRSRAVQDLVAEGPGTLSTGKTQVSTGNGFRTEEGWQVVLVRPVPSWLESGGRSQVAFAVWNGEASEAGSKKMRSVWVPMVIGGAG